MGEDQQAVEFVMSQCTMDIGGADDGVQSWTEPPEPMAADGSTAFPWDMPHPVDQARLFGPSLGLFSGPMVDHLGAEAIFNGPANNNGGDSGGGGGAITAIAGLNFNGPVLGSVEEPAKSEGAAAQRAESGSEGSDQGEIDDDENRTKSGGKRHHSKNLVAERRRRKKLNDRLYSLRSLVPKITKVISHKLKLQYIMELQKQVKELQDELEENHNQDDEAAKGSHDATCKEEKGHEMEGNEFFLKVLCEQKQGGFARLMEAMSSLGLEVTNANVTAYKPLVLNVFRAEQVRDSLLEAGQAKLTADNGSMDYHHHRHHHFHHQLNSHHNIHYLNH
ncbi:Transcription factor ABORTED MICROSPORES [Ananas comosus]|uniref:Transcription factor ABORTED MICROSPORES n=1 Tax=Ananas comosus TaxID=4615 RepID=A0A199VL04_ANACO|nr:Transcription factor ABORTED MICROSPORES [Ananas comosus]